MEEILITYKVKTLGNDEHNLELSANSTVLELKQLLENKLDASYTEMKLIFSGCVLENDQLLTDLNCTKDSFFVVFVTQKKLKTELIDSDVSDTEEEKENDIFSDESLITMTEHIYNTLTDDPSIILNILKQDPTITKMIEDSELDENEIVSHEIFINTIIIRMGIMVANIVNTPTEMEPYLEELKQEDTQDTQSLAEQHNLTEQDTESINEIIDMLGVSFFEVCQAYIVCNRDKELTVNFILNMV